MKQRLALLALPLAALSLSACGHTETHHLVFDGSSAPATSRVEVFMKSVPKRPFVERGLVQAIGDGNERAPRQVIEALQDEARRMGCDAVVKTNVQRGASATHAIGVCVRWVAPD